ncbi:hypothetical protein AVEN_208267-1 [Araneus ventricosus]|uniref:Uncharacterized protein n=1 Tax=Araneus ventricosus TaxID=182803 RepID=A0A4Y2M135_ARAVE|nr:hypothetical protein AVEN_208267-1 [Araneus ventricosus]
MLKDKGILFEKLISNGRNGKPLLNDKQRSLARSVYNFAWNKIKADQENGRIGPDDFDIDDVQSFDKKIEAALIKFERILECFKKSSIAKDNFLNSFDQCAQHCKKCVKELREIAAEIQTEKFDRDILTGVGNIFGAVGGLCFALALPVSLPLAIPGGIVCALGNGLVIGNAAGEISHLKEKLKEAVNLIEEEKKRFSAMRWFSCPEEMENAISSLVDCHVLKRMAQEVETFSKVTDKKDMTDDEFKNHYEQVLDYCMGQMAKDSKLIKEYGKELAPAVMTFVFVVCLMNDHNRIVLDCSLTTLRLTSVLNIGALACIAVGAISKLLSVWWGVSINLLLAVKSFIDAYKRPDTELTKKIREAADKIEEIFTYIERIYNETKKYKSHYNVTQWKTVLVSQTPDVTESVDLKMAVKDYLPETARGRIRLLKLQTKSDWLVMVPAIHSQRLLKQKQIEIKGKNCKITP